MSNPDILANKLNPLDIVETTKVEEVSKCKENFIQHRLYK